MRTTLHIDDEVLSAAKTLAERQNTTVGKVISELARRALTMPTTAPKTAELTPICGFRPFARTGKLVTNGLINKLRDQDAY